MRVTDLWLTDFRNYRDAHLQPAPGLTVVEGDNGEGKTNLLEALAYLATLSSFRGAPREALVRQGCDRAIIRAQVAAEGRTLLLEAELAQASRDRLLVNRQPLRRARDLLGALRVTVFSPDDLTLVKGGPGERRRYLDGLLISLHPKHDAVQADLDRVLRQRNALLRELTARRDLAGQRHRPGWSTDALVTLDVWDNRLVEVGERLASARARLVERLEPLVTKAYDQLAQHPADVSISYHAPWRAEGLSAALADARQEELRRGMTLVGPHRDDLALNLAERPSRTHASQGEQRSLALALRLAAHVLVTEVTGSSPVLLLDDVFSELDAGRAEALLAHLPSGQAVLTTTSSFPAGTDPQLRARVVSGVLR